MLYCLIFSVCLIVASATPTPTQSPSAIVVDEALILSVEWKTAKVHVQNTRFTAAMYVVHFDQDILLGGIPVSQLSLEIPPVESGYEGPMMPPAMLLQMGGATLVCPDPDGNFSSVPGSHTPPPSSGHGGAPREFLPMPSVEESAAALFKVFSADITSQDVIPKPNTFIGIKILENYNSDSSQGGGGGGGGWESYVSTSFDPSLCRVHFTGGFYDNVATQTSPLPTKSPASCSLEAYQEVEQALQMAIANLDVNTTGKKRSDMEKRMWNIASFQMRDAYVGCAELTDSLIIRGPVDRTFPGTKECFEEPFSSQWLLDPCCNQALQFTQCCARRPKVATVTGVIGTVSSSIVEKCQHPQQVETVLRAYVETEANADACEQKAKSMGADWEVTRDLMRFVDVCYEELFGKNGPPTCLSDENCYTRCDKQRGECIIPYDNPDPYLLRCFTDNIDPVVERYWRKKWGLTGLSTEEEFKTALQNNIYDASCVGPTAYQYNERWESNQTDTCEGKENCWCMSMSPHGTSGRTPKDYFREQLEAYLEAIGKAKPWQKLPYMHALSRTEFKRSEQQPMCFHMYMVEPDQTACLADMKCNWDQSKALNECTGGVLTSHFCGECHSGPCWEVSQPAMCYTWVEDSQRCTDMGGTMGPWGMWHCVFTSLTTEEECIPSDRCPPRPSIGENKEAALGERWCSPSCTADLINSQENCTAAFGDKGAWWDSQIERCMLPQWGQACVDLEDATWFPGRNYRPGVLDTQGKCEAGRCSLDNRLSATECASVASCTKQCSLCRPQNWGSTLCYSTTISTLNDCNTEGGEWDATHAKCVFDNFRTEDSCMAASNGTYTFESCETQSITNCASMLGMTTFAQARLQCYANRWDQCETQTACESSGDCDDWDFQNWHSSSCWSDLSNAKTEACTGVCVKPFDLSRGHPDCDWSSSGWSRLGCVYYDIISSAECTTAGGSWKQRAFDQQSCEAHGSGCKERNFWQLTPKESTLCSSCGGSTQSYYNWHAGSWITGEMIPLQWKAREFTSINRWQPTLNWTKLHAEVEEVANLIISKAIKSSMMCRFNLKAAALAKVACDCGSYDESLPRSDCFDTIENVPIGEQTFFSGIGGVAEWSGVSITVDPDSIPPEQDDALIEATSSGSVKVLLSTTTQQSSRRQRSPYNPNEYEVVTNHVDYIVGQLLSDGVTLTIPENVTLNVCINIDPDIPRDPENIYPEKDFAGYNATGGPMGEPKWWPLELNVTMVGNYSQFCADISESGTYFAILRAEPWEFITGGLVTSAAPSASPSSAPSPAPSASPSSAPTMVVNVTTMPPPTFAPVESSLTGGAIIGIVLGSLAGVALIVVLVVVCTNTSSLSSEAIAYNMVEQEDFTLEQSMPQKVNRYNKTRHGLKKHE